jgi:hypothetical protein
VAFNEAAFGPELLALMTRAYEAACDDLKAADVNFEPSEAVSKMMVLRIMVAVSQGERDADKLRTVAFASVAPNPDDHSADPAVLGTNR